jgi:hypothetical protein
VVDVADIVEGVFGEPFAGSLSLAPERGDFLAFDVGSVFPFEFQFAHDALQAVAGELSLDIPALDLLIGVDDVSAADMDRGIGQ